MSTQYTEYTPNWQLWLIEKSKLLKPSAWNLIFWVILIFGLIIFQGMAWKTYWLTNQRKYLDPNQVELICSNYDDMNSKYISKRGKILCKIITNRQAKLDDFVDPPYKLAEIDEINKQPLIGIDDGIYFEFSFMAPQQIGTFTVQCLTYKDIAENIQISAQDTIHIIQLTSNDIVSIDCLGQISHSLYVDYKELIICSISTQIPVSLDAFANNGAILINGEINENIKIMTEKDPSTIFKFEYRAQCNPQTLIFQVRVKGKHDNDPIIIHSKTSPLITVKMLNEYQVHLNCFNPRTNGNIISRQQLLICHIDTIQGIYARIEDFADPVISVIPHYDAQISSLRAIDNNNASNHSICSQKFEISFITPPIDVKLEIRGHLKSGNILFAEDATIIEMGHVSPRPHELNISCKGDLTQNEGIALHQETIVCQIISKFEVLKQDFADYVFILKDENDVTLNNNDTIIIKSFLGRQHKQGLREQTYKEYDIRFELIDDTLKQLRLYLVLNNSNITNIVNPNTPILINTVSCPRDGAINCKHWEWNMVNKDSDNTLRLLPSTKHYYFNDWKYIQFKGLANSDQFTELILDYNHLPSPTINESNSIFNVFSSLRKLSLKHNELTSLNQYIFKGLYNLRQIDVSYNKINSINDKTFDYVLQITQINLKNNKLREISSLFHVIHMLSNLRHLNIINNGLRYIEEEILRMETLKIIDIGGEFECIPDFMMNEYKYKINLFPKGKKCKCPAALLNNEPCGDWKYFDNHCIENNDIKQCLPTLIHNGQLSSLTALDSLDLNGFNDIGYINISNNHLTVLPNTFLSNFPKLKILDISNNKISALHSNTFQGLSLNTLILDNNNIQTLSPMLFSVSLIYLSLENNSIINIPSYVFNNLPDLQYINLKDNKLKTLPTDFLENSMELSDLILANNKLKSINKHLFDDKIITNIDFSGNNIDLLITNQFDNIKDVAILDLSRNKLNGLPNHLFNPNITLSLYTLDFSGNLLYNVAPHFLPSAKQLNFLNFGQNYLTKIVNTSFSNYNNLITLNLYSNSFREISHEMFPFSSSTIKLNLANNPLIHIDDKTFHKFPELLFLDLSYCSFTKIDIDDLNGIPKLKHLDLSHGKLEKLQINQFRHVKNIEILKISNNKLVSISELNFGTDLLKLTELHFNHNPFLWIGPTFKNLPNVKYVDLSHCNLTSKHISNDAFKNNNIISLQLSYNNLTDLNKEWFNDLKQLKKLNLSNNPIKGIKTNTFENADNLEQIDLRNTNIQCLPRWLKALGITILLHRNQQKNCISCMDKGYWSNGTNICSPCKSNEICMNEEWDETGTFRLKLNIAGKPPASNTIFFNDTDPNPCLISGILSWGEISDESIINTHEWVFYLSIDGIKTNGAPIFIVDVNNGNSYHIPIGTDVGFNRYLFMYGRNGGGDGKQFSVYHFVDNCYLCVSNFLFINESPRNYHIMGQVTFNGPLDQRLIGSYKIYVGHDPYLNDNIIAPIKHINVHNDRSYKVLISEIYTNGMPFIWIRSFYLNKIRKREDGEEEEYKDIPTNDVAAIKIEYKTSETTEIRSVSRDISMQI